MPIRTPRVHRLVVVALLLASLGAGWASAAEVGEKAPDFLLPSTTGAPISLRQFHGQKAVLLEFYTGDFDPTWTKNLATRKVDYEKFQALDIQLLGIGASHPFSQKMLADSLALPFPLLSDAAGLEVIKAYGVLSSSGTYADRYFFLIDQQGIIRGRWRGQNTGVFANALLLQAAQEILAEP